MTHASAVVNLILLLLVLLVCLTAERWFKRLFAKAPARQMASTPAAPLEAAIARRLPKLSVGRGPAGRARRHACATLR
jgi:hypothetical protein